MNRTHAVRNLAALVALALTALPAAAVSLPPGGAVALSGSPTSGGNVIRDELIPFQILDQNTGGLLFRGTVQDRVVRRADDKLIFSRRIIETLVDTEGLLTEIHVTDYSGLFTDVDWDSTSPGFHVPTLASRSGDGAQITYDFSTNPIVEGQESRFFYAETDAEAFSVSGSMTLELATGESATIIVASPVLDGTPPIAEIIEPGAFACLCDPAVITGIADDPDGTYVSHTLEYRGVNDPMWSFIGQSFMPVPAPGGTLFVWNIGALPQGYYFVRLTVENLAGLTSSAVTIAWIDQQFDVLQLGTPPNGSAVGGLVCPGGILDDHCLEEYTVDFAPDGSGAWQPVDQGNPTYTGHKINQTFAVWDSTTVPDGDYDIRVLASDPCGHTAEEIITLNVDNTPPTVAITAPMNCACVEGVVEVSGTVNDVNLAGWSLQYSGGDANAWMTIASGGGPVINGVLGVWDTTDLEPCPYALRVVASDTTQLNCNGAIHHISEFIVTVNVGTCDGGGTCQGDVNGDGMIDVVDLLILLGAWGACP